MTTLQSTHSTEVFSRDRQIDTSCPPPNNIRQQGRALFGRATLFFLSFFCVLGPIARRLAPKKKKRRKSKQSFPAAGSALGMKGHKKKERHDSSGSPGNIHAWRNGFRAVYGRLFASPKRSPHSSTPSYPIVWCSPPMEQKSEPGSDMPPICLRPVMQRTQANTTFR